MHGRGQGQGQGRGQGRGKQQRFIRATILMALLDGASHGYDLASKILRYGFVQDEVPPGMIYKHLRQMEEEGLLKSDWDAEGAGPAKRTYALTPEGGDALEAWVGFMERQAEKLNAFAALYRKRT